MALLTPEEIAARMEAGQMDPAIFHHREHIALGWHYLRTGDTLRAIEAYSAQLRAFARRIGKESLFHTTITWAYLFLIKERLAMDPGAGFEAFHARHADLFERNPPLLSRYYRPDQLETGLARQEFVMPALTGPK